MQNNHIYKVTDLFIPGAVKTDSAVQYMSIKVCLRDILGELISSIC